MTENISLAVFDAPAKMVADLTRKNELQEFDHTTEQGEKDLRSWVFRLRGGKGDIEKARKATKADALAFGKKVDVRAKELTAPLEKMITENMKPLDEIEAKKRADAEAIVEAERVASEKAEQDRLADLERREAEIAAKEAEQKAKQEESDLTELNRLADIQHEADKQAAVENARKEAAEKAEREKQEAIEKAEREKNAAIEAEKEKARQAELDRIAVENMEKAVKEKQIAEEAKKAANKTHRSNVDAKIEMTLRVITGDDELASEITKALAQGKIPNVTINY